MPLLSAEFGKPAERGGRRGAAGLLGSTGCRHRQHREGALGGLLEVPAGRTGDRSGEAATQAKARRAVGARALSSEDAGPHPPHLPSGTTIAFSHATFTMKSIAADVSMAG